MRVISRRMARGQAPPRRKSTQNERHLKSRILTRLRSKQTKKVRFQMEERSKTRNKLPLPVPAARSLFSKKELLELPNEILSIILTYFDAKELMSVRCVCRKFTNLIDNNQALWTRVSFQNLWPVTSGERELFNRYTTFDYLLMLLCIALDFNVYFNGIFYAFYLLLFPFPPSLALRNENQTMGITARNHESLIKMGLAHLYHYNLTAGVEKNEKEVKLNATYAANYFLSLDNSIAPKKSLTWMLVRPPWSSARSICLKQAVHQQMLNIKGKDADQVVYYNLGRVFDLDVDSNSDCKAINNFGASSKLGNGHASFEKLMKERTACLSDTGTQLKWHRDLQECASDGNLDACFELCRQIVLGQSEKFLSKSQSVSICRDVFQNCERSKIEKLELYQPKINNLMRCILIDWLAEVAYMKDMSHQVLHAAVFYVDRFLTTRVIERTKLQLLGITCLLLAAKSHYDPRQVHILTVRESSWLTDQTYQYEDVVKMMGEVIGTFKGDLWTPTSWDYLNILLSFPSIDSTTKELSHYLHDMSLQFTGLGAYKASQVAAAVLFLAKIILKEDNPWSSELHEHSGFEVKDIADCVAFIYFKNFTCPSMKDDRDLPLKSIKDEYLSAKHSSIAKTVIPLQVEIKNRILAADSSLSCVSQDPLQFVVMSVDMDETLNASVRSVDYDGDSEDYNDPMSDNSFDEASFCVGRTRLSSFHSEFSDDETTMDAASLNFDNKNWKFSPRESFTPIFTSVNEKIANADKKCEDGVFLFPEESEPCCSSAAGADKKSPIQDKHGKRAMKRKPISLAMEVQMSAISKRTRSNKFS